jgi:CheY-like chemotaxis protein
MRCRSDPEECHLAITILLADDNPLLRRLYVNCLQALGHRVIEVERTEEIFSLLDAHKPQLIFLDIMMPGKSGLELIGEIRRQGQARDIIAIAITTLDSGDDGNRLLSAGFNDHLEKPIHTADFRKMIAKHLNDARDSGRLGPA